MFSSSGSSSAAEETKIFPFSLTAFALCLLLFFLILTGTIAGLLLQGADGVWGTVDVDLVEGAGAGSGDGDAGGDTTGSEAGGVDGDAGGDTAGCEAGGVDGDAGGDTAGCEAGGGDGNAGRDTAGCEAGGRSESSSSDSAMTYATFSFAARRDEYLRECVCACARICVCVRMCACVCVCVYARMFKQYMHTPSTHAPNVHAHTAVSPPLSCSF